MIYILFPVAFIWWSYLLFKRGFDLGRESGIEETLWKQLIEAFRKNKPQ